MAISRLCQAKTTPPDRLRDPNHAIDIAKAGSAVVVAGGDLALAGRMYGDAAMKKAQLLSQLGFLGCKSLTMTYFHTGTRTIIGADAFHCPVRDGKEWYHVAMVIRHKGLPV